MWGKSRTEITEKKVCDQPSALHGITVEPRLSVILHVTFVSEFDTGIV